MNAADADAVADAVADVVAVAAAAKTAANARRAANAAEKKAANAERVANAERAAAAAKNAADDAAAKNVADAAAATKKDLENGELEEGGPRLKCAARGLGVRLHASAKCIRYQCNARTWGSRSRSHYPVWVSLGKTFEL